MVAKGGDSLATLPMINYWKHLCSLLFNSALRRLRGLGSQRGYTLTGGYSEGLLELQEMVTTRVLFTPCAQGYVGEGSPYLQGN